MPVSPQDFALWSNLTGNPYPQTPAERMALAPEVYQFNKNLARRGGTGMSPLRRAVDVIGKTALAAGALAGAAYLGDKYIRSQEGETQETKTDSGIAGLLPAAKSAPTETSSAPLESPSAPRASTSQIVEALGRARAKGTAGIAASRLNPPSMTEGELEEAYTTAESYRPYSTGQGFPSVTARAEALIRSLERAGAGYQKLEVDNEPHLEPTVIAEPHHAVSRTVAASADITPPTTSDRYLQDVVPNQTAITQQARGTSPAKPTVVASEMKPATQSDVIASKQQFSPGSEIEQIGDAATERQRAEAFRKSAAYSVMQNKYEGLAPIQSSTEPASAAPETLTNVQPSPQVKVAQPVDVGAALKAKGIYLSGDLESGTIQVNTEKGGTFEISHPYATHPNRGIRETALREEQAARDALQSAGVTPEQAKDYWSSKFSKPAESPVAAMAAPVKAPITSVSEPTSAVAGPSSTEIRELDTLLARSHAGHTPEQRLELRNQVLSKKYGGGPVVTPTQPPAVRVAREEAPTSGPSPESVRFARETARGMSRVGLMAQKEERRASTYSRAQFGENPASEPTGEFRELADPRLMKALMGRQTVINPY